MAKNCIICNVKLGMFKHNSKDGYICANCVLKTRLLATSVRHMTKQEIEQAIEQTRLDKIKHIEFHISREVYKCIAIDEAKQLWYRVPKVGGVPRIYDFSDIIDFELIENGAITSSGGLGAAITGGLLFGGVGAIVGSNIGSKKHRNKLNELKIKIVLNNISDPEIYINLLQMPTDSNSMQAKAAYSKAREIISILSIIKKQNESKINKPEITVSVADEIMKFKNLLDQGIITEEEFNQKKQQLLNI